MRLKVMKILYLFLSFFLLTGCKNDQLENAIRGTYYNNNYKLEITRGSGQFVSNYSKIEEKSYNRAILYKWEEEHENILIGSEIQGPGYYEIDDGQWEIEDGQLILKFHSEDGNFEDLNYQIIPINFNPSANKNWHNMHSYFILRGDKKNFFPESISQGHHSD